MEYLFQTRFFALTKTSIKLLRKRFPYREIDFNDITKIELHRGTGIKRPWISIIFGLILIIVSILLMTSYTKIQPGDLRSMGPVKVIGSILIMESFLIGLGGYSLLRAFPMHPVITFTIRTGEKESFDLSETVNEDRLDELISNINGLVSSGEVVINKTFRP